MTIWIFEDNQTYLEEIIKKVPEYLIESVTPLNTMMAAENVLNKINDNDIVFVDCQVSLIHNAGPILIAKLRANGCLCRILWHSPAPFSSFGLEASELGIKVKPIKEINDTDFELIDIISRLEYKDKWQLAGQKFLTTLTTPELPLSGLITISLLCQGYLAVVGLTGKFPNEVSTVIKQLYNEQNYSAELKHHLEEVENIKEWFELGRQSINNLIQKKGSSDEFWRSVCNGDVKLETDVQNIREFYRTLGKLLNPNFKYENNWDEFVYKTHLSLENLFARRYL